MTFPSARTPARVRRWAGAAALLAGCVALAACSSDDPVPASGDVAAPTKKPRKSPSGKPSAQPSSGSASASSEPASTAVPVYYVGDGPGGRPVLFREFHRVDRRPADRGGTAGGRRRRARRPRLPLAVAAGRDHLGAARPTACCVVDIALRRLHRAPRRHVQARGEAGGPAAGLHAAGRAAGARSRAGHARRQRPPPLRPVRRRALRAGQHAAHAQPGQHHLARRGRHGHRRHPDGHRRGQLVRGLRPVPADRRRPGGRARGLPGRGLDGRQALPVRGRAPPRGRRHGRRARSGARPTTPAAAPRATGPASTPS